MWSLFDVHITATLVRTPQGGNEVHARQVSLLGFVIAGGLLFLGNCSRRYSTTYIHVGVLWREMK